MAHFWKEEEIPKHEDTTTKRKLNQDDIQFLKELQEELNTQNHCVTANPRYWGIREKHEFPTDSNYADSNVIYCPYNEHTMRSFKEVYDYLVDMEEDYEFEELSFIDGSLVVSIDGDRYEMVSIWGCGVDDFVEFLNDKLNTELNYLSILEKQMIRQDAFFLTQKAATEHLRRNAHNYTEDARTYCMHAYRCPEYERLLEILSTVDWNGVWNT